MGGVELPGFLNTYVAIKINAIAMAWLADTSIVVHEELELNRSHARCPRCLRGYC
jgi:hypothetical protein